MHIWSWYYCERRQDGKVVSEVPDFQKKKWFSNLELNEIKEKLMGVTEESDESACEGFVGIGKEDNVACESVMLCWKILV